MIPSEDNMHTEASYEALANLPPAEQFARVDARFLSEVREDRQIEKKSSRITPRVLGEYLSMWANTTSGGLIAVGVADDGTLEGFHQAAPGHASNLESGGANACPDARFQCRRVPFHHTSGTEDFVLLFHVQYHETRAVATVQGEYFVRIGDQRRKLKDDLEIRELRDAKGEVRAEMEPVPLEYPEDFDLSAVEQFSAAVRQRDMLDDTLNAEEILARQLLGTLRDGRFKPNLACALLFAKTPRLVAPGCHIRFLRFDGEVEGTGEKWNAVKDLYVEGTIPEQLRRIAEVLRSQLRTFSPLAQDGRFSTTNEYPEDAWYEAVVNACVHRTYSNGLRNADVFIKMFDDRLEILSPGSFMPFVTPENVYTVVSVPRNPFLMGALKYLDFVKIAREGTRRMKATMGAMGLPEPEFKVNRSVGTHVTVILRNQIQRRRVWFDSDLADRVGAAIVGSLTALERRCLEHVAEHGIISVDDLKQLASISNAESELLLDGLVQRGILSHSSDRSSHAGYVLPSTSGGG